LARDGHLDLERPDGSTKRVRIRRLHLEEDAGRLVHDPLTGKTLVDLNRCGVPLIEIVTEPDLRSPEEAALFVKQLRQLLRYAGVSRCDMERGELRVDANLSIAVDGRPGTKTEIKNMNSFQAIEKALKVEEARQRMVLERGGTVQPQTFGWNPEAGRVEPQRAKEEAEDYRYFPDPDLVPLLVDEAWRRRLRAERPERPRERRRRLFERAVALFPQPKEVSNWLLTEVFRLLDEAKLAPEALAERLPPERLVQVLRMVQEGRINRNTGKAVLEEAFRTGREPEAIVEERKLGRIADEARLAELAEQVLQEHPQAAQDFKAGNERVLGFLVGRLMAKTQGRADPKLAAKVLREKLAA